MFLIHCIRHLLSMLKAHFIHTFPFYLFPKYRNEYQVHVCFSITVTEEKKNISENRKLVSREKIYRNSKTTEGRERRKITRLLFSEQRENMFLSILGGKVSSCLIYPLRSNNPGVLNASSVVPYPETPSKILNCN